MTATTPTIDNRPRRIQLRRTKGWRKPEGTVVVARPTKWGNPFPVENGDHVRAVHRYYKHLAANPQLVEDARRELAGKVLACWCPPERPCHALALLDAANLPDKLFRALVGTF